MTLLVHSTPAALWHAIIHEAESSCDLVLKEEVESYLVFLLMRYINKPELAKYLIAPRFLEGSGLPNSQKEPILQEVGDSCLLFAGLFPNIAEKKRVKISYFVNLGQASYGAISKRTDDLYQLMAEEFVTSMDILQAIRRYSNDLPELMPLQAYDLWNETGSKRALEILKRYTGATPLFIHPDKR